MTTMTKTRSALDRAVANLPLEIRLDCQQRLAQVDADIMRSSGLHASALVGSLHSHCKVSVATPRPDLAAVKRLHAAWVAAHAYSEVIQ